MALPKYFKPILWFDDFNKINLNKDKDLILYQVLEKGRMEHLKYLQKKLGNKAIYDFAKKNNHKFTRKSILAFVKLMYS